MYFFGEIFICFRFSQDLKHGVLAHMLLFEIPQGQPVYSGVATENMNVTTVFLP